VARSLESQLKRARELALKERRERKQEKRAARAAARLTRPDAPSTAAPFLDEAAVDRSPQDPP
jgi:hypothetical protein